MTPTEARERYDLARDMSHADDGDRVTTADGVELVVLVSALTGERKLVHADVVEYGTVDHPAVTGLIGFLNVAAALVVPILVGASVALGDASIGIRLAGGAAGTVGGFVLSNLLLNYTPAGDWLFRFLEWNDHRNLIMARGETA